MEKLYPFSRREKVYPKSGGLIVKENFNNEVWLIEYDSEMIMNTLENKGLEDFSDFPKITKNQLISFLTLTTYNIVRVKNYELREKENANHE